MQLIRILGTHGFLVNRNHDITRFNDSVGSLTFAQAKSFGRSFRDDCDCYLKLSKLLSLWFQNELLNLWFQIQRLSKGKVSLIHLNFPNAQLSTNLGGSVSSEN